MINAGKHQIAVRYVDSGKLGMGDSMHYVLKLNLLAQLFTPSVIKTELNPALLFFRLALMFHLSSAWQRGVDDSLTAPHLHSKLLC